MHWSNALHDRGMPKNVIHHSDRGVQYLSIRYTNRLEAANLQASVGTTVDSYDNAVTESFFHTLKGHVIYGSMFATRKEANAVLFDYIEIYYNRVRRHSANG